MESGHDGFVSQTNSQLFCLEHFSEKRNVIRKMSSYTQFEWAGFAKALNRWSLPDYRPSLRVRKAISPGIVERNPVVGPVVPTDHHVWNMEHAVAFAAEQFGARPI